MRVLRGSQPEAGDRPCVVTIGMFDGVHRGHALLHERVLADARADDLAAAVVTFDPHPLEVLAPARAPCLLTTLEQRLALFEGAGFDAALVLPFDRELASLTPELFTQRVLVDALHVRRVVVGEDFRFGHGRAGDVATLAALGTAHGFDVEPVGLLSDGGAPIASSAVRQAVGDGDMPAAAAALGRAYRLAGEVVHGDGRGRELGFPTANLRPHPRACLPGDGIYAGWWVLDGRRSPAAINVGQRPTFGEGQPSLCEVYVLDFDGDLYGAAGEAEFTAFLRPEERFSSVEALVEQIARDVDRTRELLLG